MSTIRSYQINNTDYSDLENLMQNENCCSNSDDLLQQQIDELGPFPCVPKVSDCGSLLDLKKGDRVAIIGSGGKTTLLNSIGAWSLANKWNSVATTTTRLQYQKGFIPFEKFSSFKMFWEKKTDPKLVLTGVYSSLTGKISGLTPQQADLIQSLPDVDLLVVEADGSRQLPLKIHADHEPILFQTANYGIAVIGMEAYGVLPQEGKVHRPELVRQFLHISDRHAIGVLDILTASLSYLRKLPMSRKALIISQINLINRPQALLLAELFRSYAKDDAKNIKILFQHDGILTDNIREMA